MSQARPQTILFADVSGSTRLFETRGDVEARRLIAAVLDAMGKVARMYGGRVVKTIGDEVMVTLPTAVDGLLAACDMQRKIERDPAFALDDLCLAFWRRRYRLAGVTGLQRREAGAPAGGGRPGVAAEARPRDG